MEKSKIVLIFLLSLIINFSIIDASFGQMDCDTDEITGNTICKTGLTTLHEIDADTRDADFQLFFSKDDRSYFGLLTGFASDWQWLKAETIYFLAGDKRYKFEISRNDSQVDGGNTAEQMIVYLSAEDIKNMFSSDEKVKLKIADDSYEIDYYRFKDQAIELVETVETAKKYWYN